MNQIKHKAFDFSVRGEVRYQESMRHHTAADIENLIDKVQSVVNHRQGIELEREIQIIGARV